MAGNLENTGWAKPGTECAYNIFTMDETETVLACGAGGVTKLKNPYSEDLSRIFNFKYSYEYISRYLEILERKEGIAKQYEQFRKRLHKYINHLEQINDAALLNPQVMIDEVEDSYHEHIENIARNIVTHYKTAKVCNAGGAVLQRQDDHGAFIAARARQARCARRDCLA